MNLKRKSSDLIKKHGGRYGTSRTGSINNEQAKARKEVNELLNKFVRRKNGTKK